MYVYIKIPCLQNAYSFCIDFDIYEFLSVGTVHIDLYFIYINIFIFIYINIKSIYIYCIKGAFPVAQLVKNPPAKAEDAREIHSIPGSGRCPGEGNGNLL